MNDSLVSQPDQLLIQQTLQGNRDAFAGLVEKYQDRLYTAMVYMLRNEAEAEDVVQDAFILALTRLESFRGNSAFYTWLYRITYNTAVSRIRRRKPTVSLTGFDDSGQQLDFESGGPGPGERMSRSEDICLVRNAMELLSDEHRSILIMREMDDMDYEAISEVLQLPIGTVRSRLHRARSHLKKHIESLSQPSRANLPDTP